MRLCVPFFLCLLGCDFDPQSVVQVKIQRQQAVQVQARPEVFVNPRVDVLEQLEVYGLPDAFGANLFIYAKVDGMPCLIWRGGHQGGITCDWSKRLPFKN